ncbi:MAG: metallophosphoesterase [Treponema sp.]|nr:metallophosphoesterase [Treponema sp.]
MLKDFSRIKEGLFSVNLPDHDYFFNLCEKTCDLLEKEITNYRPADNKGRAGGLLDFTKNPLPTVIVPDIHARPDFIFNILNYKLPKEYISYSDRSLFHALKKGLVRIICVGDALHTEKTILRWQAIQAEFDSRIYTGPAMSAEMLEGLNTITALMELKLLFPDLVHFIKGNHENILNKSGNGDYAFRKYADEGNMVKKFMFEIYGDDILYMISCLEKELPLISANKDFVVSHAEPENIYSREEFINVRENPNIIEDLIWTANGDVTHATVPAIMKELLNKENLQDSYYFAGHRPVNGDYLLRQNGLFVQIHNPSKQNIVFIDPNKNINLEESIIHLDKKRGKK